MASFWPVVWFAEGDDTTHLFWILLRWWFFNGFYHGIHHHVSPPLGDFFYFFQPPNKQIQGYIGVTISPALEDSISANLDFMSGNFRIFWSWLVCLCLKMMVYISPMWLKTHTNSEMFSWFGLLGFIYAYFLPVHYDKSGEYVWICCATIWSFRVLSHLVWGNSLTKMPSWDTQSENCWIGGWIWGRTSWWTKILQFIFWVSHYPIICTVFICWVLSWLEIPVLGVMLINSNTLWWK